MVNELVATREKKAKEQTANANKRAVTERKNRRRKAALSKIVLFAEDVPQLFIWIFIELYKKPNAFVNCPGACNGSGGFSFLGVCLNVYSFVQLLSTILGFCMRVARANSVRKKTDEEAMKATKDNSTKAAKKEKQQKKQKKQKVQYTNPLAEDD